MNIELYAKLLGFFILFVGLLFVVLSIYTNKNPDKKRRAMKGYLWIVLVCYFIFLFVLTFGIGRSTPVWVFSSKECFINRLKTGFNIIPFKNIISLFQNDYTKGYFIVNLIGNLGALMPLGLLFPLLFPNARKPLTFTLMTTLVVLFIELVQFIFCVGAFDIDDLILNVSGALIVYGVFNFAKNQKKRQKIIIKMIKTVIIIILIAIVWFELPVVEHIKISGNGKINSPVRIALVTDLHSCYYGRNQAQLIKMIDDENVDIILLSGDIFDNKFGDTNAKNFIEGVCDRYSCYYVTGNHEIWSGRQDEIKEYLNEKNVMVLDGSYSIYEKNGNTIIIAGVDDPTYMTVDEWTHQLDEAVCDEEYSDNYKILLSHRPEKGDVYSNYDYDLVVCGHAHGGQWRIPFTKYGVAAPNQSLFPEFVDGLYKLSNDEVMVVSRGLCRERMPYPRFFNHPEIVIIDVE